MKTGRILGNIAFVIILAVVIGSYFYSKVLGFIFTVLWLFGGAGSAPMMFYEMDWKDPDPATKNTLQSKYTDVIGLIVETASELKPYGYISINGERVAAKSSLEYIPNNTRVEIIEVASDTMIVQKI